MGPRSRRSLEDAGITSREQLAQLGAAAAFLRVKGAGMQPSLNLLYALEGALTNTGWNKLSQHDRAGLLFELD